MLYSFFLYCKSDAPSLAQNYWQGNTIRAQQYAYSDTAYDYVIAGTSISEGLNLDIHDKKTFTLNFIGGSVFTALELIKRKNHLPGVILIETNLVDRPSDEQLLQRTTHPVLVSIRKNVPAFRAANQPVSIFAGQMQPHIPVPLEAVDSEYYHTRLKEIYADYTTRVDTALLFQYVTKLVDNIEYLKQKGSKVYLVEIPVDPRIQSSLRYRITRQYLDQAAKNSQVAYIPHYQLAVKSSDGVHMTQKSRSDYSAFLSHYLSAQ